MQVTASVISSKDAEEKAGGGSDCHAQASYFPKLFSAKLARKPKNKISHTRLRKEMKKKKKDDNDYSAENSSRKLWQ